jgi:hypothetical protein
MTLTKSALLMLAIAGCFAAGHDVQAALPNYTLISNAPAHCQAFIPGAANTIRNRVIRSENVGPTMTSLVHPKHSLLRRPRPCAW